MYSITSAPTGPIDVCFVVDVSGSISFISQKNYLDMLEFLKNIVFSFDIGPNDARVAIVKFR